jgi:hypothetical protein
MTRSKIDQAKLTHDDLLRLPEDNLRHEIIDGVHFVNASPNLYHQTVSRRIQHQLYTQIELPGHGSSIPISMLSISSSSARTPTARPRDAPRSSSTVVSPACASICVGCGEQHATEPAPTAYRCLIPSLTTDRLAAVRARSSGG